MKKFILVVFLIMSNTSFSQQFLWTTNNNGLFPNSNIKVIPKEQVLDKILEYYEAYRYYFDLSGYTKAEFFNTQGESFFANTDWEMFKKSVFETRELTITSIKSNSGSGSSILILISKKDNFEAIRFSNEGGRGAELTSQGRSDDYKKRFIKFYQSLIE
jgi:hypothetical protein